AVDPDDPGRPRDPGPVRGRVADRVHLRLAGNGLADDRGSWAAGLHDGPGDDAAVRLPDDDRQYAGRHPLRPDRSAGARVMSATTTALTDLNVGSQTRRAARKSEGLVQPALSALVRDRVAMTAFIIVIVLVIFALGAGVVSRLTGFTPQENHLAAKLSAPGENGYILGSDATGWDILTRLASGARISLTVAVLATFFELTIGLGVGLIAGYAGKWVDFVLMRLVDVLLSIPTLPLLILISTLYRPGTYMLALILALVSWPGDSRLLRGEALSLKSREYVDAANVVGVSPVGIVLRYILPN